jgi:hypothetical protein
VQVVKFHVPASALAWSGDERLTRFASELRSIVALTCLQFPGAEWRKRGTRRTVRKVLTDGDGTQFPQPCPELRGNVGRKTCAPKRCTTRISQAKCAASCL